MVPLWTLVGSGRGALTISDDELSLSRVVFNDLLRDYCYSPAFYYVSVDRVCIYAS